MVKFIVTTTFLFIATSIFGQIVIKNRYGQQDENNLLKLLRKKTDDISRIETSLEILDYHLNLIEYHKPNLGSAAMFIGYVKALNARQTSKKFDGRILLDETKLALKNGSLDSAKHFASEAIKVFQTSGDTVRLIQAYLQLSRCYDPNAPDQVAMIKNLLNKAFQLLPNEISPEELGKYTIEFLDFYTVDMTDFKIDLQINLIERLVQLNKTHQNKIDEFWARKELADLHYRQGNLYGAIDELLEIAREQQTGRYPGICFTYDLLAGMYYTGGNWDKSMYYSLETLKNVKTKSDSLYLSDFYLRLARNYSASGSIAQAVELNMRRADYLISTRQTNDIYNSLFGITTDLIKLGRKKEALDMIVEKSKKFVPVDNWEKTFMLLSLTGCYKAVENYTMAEFYSEELIKLSDERIRHKEIPSDMTVDQFLSSFYLETGQYNKAWKFFGRYVKDWPSAPKESNPSLYFHQFLFQFDSAKGNYISAIKHLQALHRTNDSIFTATKSKQIEEFKIMYATEQKDSIIALNKRNIQLLQQQDELQKTKLHQGTILRNISFAVAALLIIIVALLFNRYRLKLKTNRKLESQQQEIAKQNLSLHHLVNEKDWLVKEIHHRVKNNLQIVMSLLNSQSAYINNEPALTAIHDSQHRVHAMSLIHQKLYNSENVSFIDMPVYIRELVSYLADSFNTGQRIRFELKLEPLEMDVSQAVPLGLILNEAITNSIKYAFPDGRSGVISIFLSTDTRGHYLLNISDNGVGMPANYNNRSPGSLGMSLIAGLSEDLDGNFSIESKNGTTIKISFAPHMGERRPNTPATSVVSNNYD